MKCQFLTMVELMKKGKKIRLQDGLDALWYLIKFNVLIGLKRSFRREFLEANAYPKRLP